MTTKQPTRLIPADSTLYLTDNGALYCGAHLGMSAAYTGRDISGQKIKRLTASDLDYLASTARPIPCARRAARGLRRGQS
jgi:hypothetical protein